MSVDFNILKDVYLFNQIAPEEFLRLLPCLSPTTARYRKNDIIFLEGTDVTRVGILLSGNAHVIKEDIWGNRTIISDLGTKDLFGESFSCAKVKKLPVTVVAASDCEVLFIEYKRILTTCTSACVFHAKLIENMMSILASKNILLQDKLQILSKPTTREKLLAYLNSQSQKLGSLTFMIPFDRQQLADYLCVDRSAMTKELGRLRDEGLISFHRSSFKLHKTNRDF